MCNGLEDHKEINESVVGKIPKSVNGQLYSVLWYGPLYLEGISDFLKLQSKWVISTHLDNSWIILLYTTLQLYLDRAPEGINGIVILDN